VVQLGENRFDEMVTRIVSASNLDIAGGRLTQAMINEISVDEAKKQTFIKKYHDNWSQFKEKFGKHKISPYLEWAGPSLIKYFLSYLYSFNENQITTDKCTRGKSNVDAILCVDYVFTRDELNLLQTKIDAYRINKDPKEAAKMLLSNAMKVLPYVLKDIFNLSYRLFTSSVDVEDIQDAGAIKVSLKYDGRIG